MSANRNRNKVPESGTMNFDADMKQYDYCPKQRTSPKYNERSRDKDKR